jgi:hypothetical protein
MAWIKTVSMKEGVKAFLVMKDGDVDQKLTLAKFEGFLTQYTGKSKADTDLILGCINALFDQYKGSSINQDGIASMVIRKMGEKNKELTDVSLWPMLSKRVKEVLKENIGEGKLFAVRLGPGGGTYRVADQTK